MALKARQSQGTRRRDEGRERKSRTGRCVNGARGHRSLMPCERMLETIISLPNEFEPYKVTKGIYNGDRFIVPVPV